jgi:hypothetical protein
MIKNIDLFRKLERIVIVSSKKRIIYGCLGFRIRVELIGDQCVTLITYVSRRFC